MLQKFEAIWSKSELSDFLPPTYIHHFIRITICKKVTHVSWPQGAWMVRLWCKLSLLGNLWVNHIFLEDSVCIIINKVKSTKNICIIQTPFPPFKSHLKVEYVNYCVCFRQKGIFHRLNYCYWKYKDLISCRIYWNRSSRTVV